jgi:hypothetical protein
MKKKADFVGKRLGANADHYHAVWSALDGVINAWEELPGGRDYSPLEISDWLKDHMSPAIGKARDAMGRKVPS